MSSSQTSLTRLEIHNLRNIEAARMNFGAGLNVITGQNAAGKTSLLEAIYLLGRVRSFRTSVADRMIATGKDRFLVLGKFQTDGGQLRTIGVSRQPGCYQVRMEGETIRRLSDLAGEFPVNTLSNDTQNIITGGPRHRRHALDWALFHVEPGYRDAWQRLHRALKQRNAALRRQLPREQITIWDDELINVCADVDRMRQSYLDALVPYIEKELDWLFTGGTFTLRYLNGWGTQLSFADVLGAMLEKDRALGYTQQGPHRADFILQADGKPVRDYFSRGQIKSLLASFLIGQARLQRSYEVPLGAFLMDDFASELDHESQARLLDSLASLQQQIFVTAIHSAPLFDAHPGEIRRFHVEHGVVKELL